MDPVSPGVISGLVVEAVAGLARPLLARGREPHTANLAAPSAQALQLTVVHALTVRGFTHPRKSQSRSSYAAHCRAYLCEPHSWHTSPVPRNTVPT